MSFTLGTFENYRRDTLAAKKRYRDQFKERPEDWSKGEVGQPPASAREFKWAPYLRADNIRVGRSAGAVATDLQAVSLGQVSEQEAQADIARTISGGGERLNDLRPLFKDVAREAKETEHPGLRYAWVDIETTCLNESVGDIIEVGLLVTDEHGNTIEEVDELFGLSDPDFERAIGMVGAEAVHGIGMDKLDGLVPFTSDNPAYEKVREVLCDPEVIMVSHNKNFENAWFSLYLDGFFEVHQRSLPDATTPRALELDTKTVTRMLTDASALSLQAFVEKMGLAYVNAHRAMNDVVMMKDAFFRVRDAL